ncbi:BatD family protein [Pseudoalteromonas mariniglutinosa]|uniref:BatD family protein n=1 Tax=Pseudoalteromonas mariniglutinosa TaxID=206042 RepID=UPI00384B7D13
MVMRLFCCLLLITALPSWAATQLQASVDKNPVLAGEFFVLNLTINDSIQNEQPDTSALLKNFVVGPTSVSSRTNIINGEITKQTTWSVKLMTRKEGNYTIPSFAVAGASSEPIQLKVAKRNQTSEQSKDAFIETSLKPSSLYVQEAGVYTIKLYLARDLLDGNLSTPSMTDAQLSQIGKQSENYELIDGKRYLVISRDYLVQPQKSGDYTITAPAFNGRVRQNYRQMELSALGEDIDVTVKPIPDNYQGAWLPSELVNLDEQWQPEDDSVEVGTPITRTITLTALGITKEQLPDIEMPQIQGFRSYPDEKENNHLVRDGRVISQQTASYALLPQTPGTYTLPEIKVPWFNTKINRISYATLPARQVTVLPSSNALTAPLAQPPTAVASNSAVRPSIIQTKGMNESVTWLKIVAIMGYLLWLSTLIAWWFKHQRTAEITDSVSVKQPVLPSLTQLKKLAKAQHYAEFYAVLQDYAKQCTGENHHAIDALCEALADKKLTDEIAKLRSKLYSSADTTVELTSIVSRLSHNKTTATRKQPSELSDLYD